MKKEAIKLLFDNYDKIKTKNKVTTLKFSFYYNSVQVNLYFDNFDNSNPLLVLILCYKDEYYYTTLNARKDTNKMDYLPEIQPIILNKILNKQVNLDDFLSRIETEILSERWDIINYFTDSTFNNTLKYYKKSDSEPPFLYSLRRANMTEETFRKLKKFYGIDSEILNVIRNEGYTIVRTRDPKLRKNIKMVCKAYNITL